MEDEDNIVSLKDFGEEYATEFFIDDNLAFSILKEVAPDRISDTVVSYTLQFKPNAIWLVALNADRLIEFKIKLEDESVLGIVEASDYKETLELYEHRITEYKSIRRVFYLFSILIVLIVLALVYLVLYSRRLIM